LATAHDIYPATAKFMESLSIGIPPQPCPGYWYGVHAASPTVSLLTPCGQHLNDMEGIPRFLSVRCQSVAGFICNCATRVLLRVREDVEVYSVQYVCALRAIALLYHTDNALIPREPRTVPPHGTRIPHEYHTSLLVTRFTSSEPIFNPRDHDTRLRTRPPVGRRVCGVGSRVQCFAVVVLDVR
jgi:hypothetical protein